MPGLAFDVTLNRQVTAVDFMTDILLRMATDIIRQPYALIIRCLMIYWQRNLT